MARLEPLRGSVAEAGVTAVHARRGVRMRRRLVFPHRLSGALAAALAGAVLLRCAGAGKSGPGDFHEAAARRAVVISFDGLGGVRLRQLMDTGKLTAGGFAEFARRGIFAGRAVTVTPSLTAVAHVAAITGVAPARTGIVSNVFHRPGDPFGAAVSGFSAEIEAETLWEAAMRQGKRVGVIVYPGADATTARRRGNFGMIWPDHPLRPPVLLALPPERWSEGRSDARSFSPPRHADARLDTPGAPLAVGLDAVDSTDDGIVDYDLLRMRRADGSVLAEARQGDWFQIAAAGPPGEGPAGAWCRIVRLDPRSASAVLYVGGFFGVPAYPVEYRDRLAAEVGPWPGPPDDTLLREAGDPWGDDAYLEQSLRLLDYLSRVLVVTIRRERWDLLIHYQPVADEVEHVFEPVRGAADVGPPGSDERIERTYAAVDRELAGVLAELRSDDSIFVHSDHGMSAVTCSVNLERFLEIRGWRIQSEPAVAPEAGAPRVQVCATSGIAHLYLPHAPREAPPAEPLRRLRLDLKGLSAEPGVLVDRVLGHEELFRYGLDNPNAGDVVLLLRPGCVFETDGASASVMNPPHKRGAHGYRNVWPHVDAAYLAIGPTVRPGRPETVSLLDLAPAVSRALGIAPPGASRTGARGAR